MSQTTGLNINDIFTSSADAINRRGTEIQDQMEAMMKDGTLDPGEMIKVQFSMGQYTAIVEATNSIVKSLNDTVKSVAQRAG